MSFSKGFCFAALALFCFSANASVSPQFKDSGSVIAPTGHAYIGIFGGAGHANGVSMSQRGIALYGAAAGGPLSVNATGSDSAHTDFGGIRAGYEWTGWLLTNTPSSWLVAPALEVEGFYLFNNEFNKGSLNNPTPRLPEHDFIVSLPMHTGVALVNAVFDLKTPIFVDPYIGFGIGGAGINIYSAYSAQIKPPEPGINHFNSSTHSNAYAFAAQLKAGLNFKLLNNLKLSAEYRLLYLSPTTYSFGSTQYITHVPTTSWAVNLGRMLYNMGDIALTYSFL